MSEIKTEIKPNEDGSYTITDAHSTADIVRWLLTQDSKETIAYLLGEEKPADEPVGYWQGEFSKDGGATIYEVPQESAFGRKYRNIPLYPGPQPTREWVGLTDEEIERIVHGAANGAPFRRDGTTSQRIARVVEAKLKEKNNAS